MIDTRKYLWVLVAIFAVGIGVGLVAPHFKGCAPGPDVPVVVVPDTPGPRTALVIRETDQTEPAFGQAVTLLRNGDYDKYLIEHGHSLLVLDDDLPDMDKYIPPAQHDKSWLLILNNGDLLHAEQLKVDAEPKAIAEQLMSALKAHGG